MGQMGAPDWHCLWSRIAASAGRRSWVAAPYCLCPSLTPPGRPPATKITRPETALSLRAALILPKCRITGQPGRAGGVPEGCLLGSIPPACVWHSWRLPGWRAWRAVWVERLVSAHIGGRRGCAAALAVVADCAAGAAGPGCILSPWRASDPGQAPLLNSGWWGADRADL